MTRKTTADRWIAYRKPNPQARLRLFCLHYAGGAASAFRGWQAELPPEIEVCPVQLPGRESRLREDRLNSVEEVLEVLPGALEPYMDMPFAFFGHSMGALLSYELTARLNRDGRSLPVRLLLSGRRAPQVPDDDPPIYDLPDDEFKAELRKLNGTPEAVLEHPELMELLLPVLRADFTLCETYEYQPSDPLPVALSAYGGLSDHKVEREALEAWRERTRGAFKLRMFEGDHFFLHGPARGDLIAAVAQDLMPVLARLQGRFV
jgi:medium-chain acyl-[acyl-carrier-protein] hydrolase